MHSFAMLRNHTAALSVRMAATRRASGLPATFLCLAPPPPLLARTLGRQLSSNATPIASADSSSSGRRTLVPNPIVVSLVPNRTCTLVFALKDPDSAVRSTSTRHHTQLKVLLPIDDPTVSAIDLISALRSEVAGDLKLTRGFSEHAIADAKLDQMTVWQFLHSNAVCWIRGVPYCIDPTGLVANVQQLRASLADMERKAQAGSEKLAQVDARVRKQLDWAVHGGTAFFWAELTTIVYLTNELGWDLMEPTSYLLGLTTLTLGSAFYALLGREFTYHNMTASLESWLTRRFVTKERIDVQQIQEAIQAVEKTRRQMQPIFASAAHDFGSSAHQ